MNKLKIDPKALLGVYASGASLRGCAAKFKTSHAVIARILREEGVLIRKNEGPSHHGFKGGRMTSAGYKMLKMPVHPRADKMGYVFEHILVMERKIGRHLHYEGHGKSDNEEVHHKNENRSDNRIENLELKTRRKHLQDHKRKLTMEQADSIRKKIKGGSVQRRLAKEFQVSESLVSAIKLGHLYVD